MDIHGFAAAMVQTMEAARLTGEFVNEAAFEKRHLVEPAWELARRHPEIRVFTHPCGRTARCTPTCEAGAVEFTNRMEGCPTCWTNSKRRSVADVFGTRNNFDLAAIDRSGGTLAVEAKLLSLAANKGPNSEFQRFVGQCALAAAANDVVLGVCGLRGRRTRAFDIHEHALKSKLEKIGVHLVVIRAESWNQAG